MIYRNKNFCRSKINNYIIVSGDEFINCNFSQSNPNTEILVNVTGIKFINCNILNCNIPNDSIKIGCLHIQKSMCSHLHPNRLLTGELEECIENCIHVIDSDEIMIDSVSVSKIYHYEDSAVL